MTHALLTSGRLDGPLLVHDVPSRYQDVIAVIPAFNEERFIASVVLTTLQYVGRVIVVDDGSSDHTARLAEQAGATVVRQSTNQGKAHAINAGFRLALSLHPAAVVCLDGDAQHNAADLPLMVRPILEDGVDVVVGSRFLEVRNTAPGWRQVGQNALTHVTNLTSGVHLTDSQSGFRSFSPAALGKLHFATSGLGVESEMQFLLANSGLTVREVPITVSYLDGNKRNPVVHGLQVLDAILSLVARRRPLLFFSLPGVMVVMIGLLTGFNVWTVVENTGVLMGGRALLAGILGLGGLLLALTGVLLHSVQHMASQIAGEIGSSLRQAVHRE